MPYIGVDCFGIEIGFGIKSMLWKYLDILILANSLDANLLFFNNIYALIYIYDKNAQNENVYESMMSWSWHLRLLIL